MQLGLPFAPLRSATDTSIRHEHHAGAPSTGSSTSASASASARASASTPQVDFVRHPRARRYVIHVRLDGTVRVTIPRRGSMREARAFVERQQQWIDKRREQVALENARPRKAIAPDVEREWRARARRELPARLLELATAHGLRVDRVSVRNQRWRWGSCSRRGHICLNWRLAQMPPSIRDYVMLHELMHLKRMDHSPRFWKLVERACPDYQIARKWLREHASGLEPPPTDL
jgi:predicted metal-dependent hydrolase